MSTTHAFQVREDKRIRVNNTFVGDLSYARYIAVQLPLSYRNAFIQVIQSIHTTCPYTNILSQFRGNVSFKNEA